MEEINKNDNFEKAVKTYLSRLSTSEEQEAAYKTFYNSFVNKGGPESAFWLGKCYLFGRGTEICYSKATELMRIATKSEQVEIKQLANYYLSLNYRFGRGVENDHNFNLNKIFANKYLLKSAELGYDQAQYEAGIRALFGVDMNKDEKLGVHMLMRASNPTFKIIENKNTRLEGYAKAQKMLSFCYQNGVGIEQDVVKAHAYYESSHIDENNLSKNKLNKYFYDIDAELEEFVSEKKSAAASAVSA